MYLKQRGSAHSSDEQFFVFKDGSAVKPENMCLTLKKVLVQLGLDYKAYYTQSLRIGRASDMVNELNLSVESVKKAGHWTSNTVYTYLR